MEDRRALYKAVRGARKTSQFTSNYTPTLEIRLTFIMAHTPPDVFAIKAQITLEEVDAEDAVEYIPTLSTPLPSLPPTSEQLFHWHDIHFSDFQHIAPNLNRDRLLRDRVCIVGGGVSGLYVARLLDVFGVPYDVIEANGRVGGQPF